MAPNSSIFSSESQGELKGAPWGRAMLVLVAALLLIGSASSLLRRLFLPSGWGGEQTQTLFVGTSHFDGAVAYRRLPMPSGLLFLAGADQQLLSTSLLKHLEHWPALKCAVLELDEMTLLSDRAWQHRKDLSVLASELDLDAWELPSRGDAPRRMATFALGLLRGRGWAALSPSKRLTLTNLEAALTTRPGPWVPDTSPPPPVVKTSTLSVELSRRGVEFLEREGADPRWNLEALVEAAQALKQRGVRVILLTTPNHRYYRELRPAKWDALIAEGVRRVNEAAGPVPHWDYRSDPGFGDEDFNNATHLHAASAVRFTEGLAGRLSAEGCGP